MCNSQPIYFEAKKEGGKVIAHFTAFKGAKDIPTRMSMLGEPVYREASSVKLILSEAHPAVHQQYPPPKAAAGVRPRAERARLAVRGRPRGEI